MPAHDGAIELTWGGDLRRFRLAIDQLLALQEAADCGPAELYNRLRFGTWRLDALQAVFRLGLIGGGMDGREAKKLIDRVIVPGDILAHIDPAIDILGAALAAPEPLGKPKAEGETAASPPPPSTATAPSSDSRQSKLDA